MGIMWSLYNQAKKQRTLCECVRVYVYMVCMHEFILHELYTFILSFFLPSVDSFKNILKINFNPELCIKYENKIALNIFYRDGKKREKKE